MCSKNAHLQLALYIVWVTPGLQLIVIVSFQEQTATFLPAGRWNFDSFYENFFN